MGRKHTEETKKKMTECHKLTFNYKNKANK